MVWIIPTRQVVAKDGMPRALFCTGDWSGCRTSFETHGGTFACWDVQGELRYRGYCCMACFLFHCDQNTMTRH